MPIDITDQPRRAQYAISGVGPYDVDFEILAETDIAVYRDATLLALTTDYTVVVNADGTSAVTLVSATGTTLTIVGARPYRRITDYATGGDFLATTMNDELDSLEIQILQIAESVNRSIKVAAYDTSGVSSDLPISRANGYLAFDADGNAVISSGTGADAGLREDLAASDTGLGDALVAHLSPDADAATESVFSILRSRVRPQTFGAQGDGVTNDTAAILKAMQRAANRNCLCEIPGTDLGYRVNTAIVATDLDYLMVEGEGILIPVGGNAITLDSTVHASIRGIGIYGTSGSGHGIELINGSNANKFFDLWLGWMDGDGIKITSGQSNVFTNVDVDQNNGFRPVTLQGGLTDGEVSIGVHNPSHASNLTFNNTFVNCRINGCGQVYALKVGTTAGGLIESFQWTGGLIQGVEALVYLHAKSSTVETHIEPPTGVITSYVVTMDECQNTVVRNSQVLGDAQMTGANYGSGFEHCVGGGYDISATSVDCFVRDCQYSNIVTGPGSGVLIDRSNKSSLENNRNASNEYVHIGRNTGPHATEYLSTNFEDWASATQPCGFSNAGGTVSIETASIVRTFTKSAKVIHAVDLTGGLKIRVVPGSAVAGKFITVEAWAYAASGAAYIQASEDSGTIVTSQKVTDGTGSWQRIVVSFRPSAAAATFDLTFTGLIGTVYWDSIRIMVDDYTKINELALADSATPDVSYNAGSGIGGYYVPTVVTSATTAITNFVNGHVGKEITVRLGANTDFTDGASLQLAGGANFTTGVTGDMIRFVLGSDYVWRETGRSVD